MIRQFHRITLLKYAYFTNNNRIILYRGARNINRRDSGPKIIEGKVKLLTKYDDYNRIESLDDLAQDMKRSKCGYDLDVEKAFLEDDDSFRSFEKCNEIYETHLREEKMHKKFVKKSIIGRKYFKLDKETNLLTYAAKEQIRFLHKSDPLQWTCKTIAECFPISEKGAKKLLKSQFALTSPEKIKAHDEDVAKKWEILKSGLHSEHIAPKTRQVYEEGKLNEDYFSGNPNLPTVPPIKKIEIKRKEKIGEFSSIVKTYVDYQKQKLLEDGKDDLKTEVSVKGNNLSELQKTLNSKTLKNFKYAYEEVDDESAEIFPLRKKEKAHDADVPLSQFKEILKDGTLSSNKAKYITKEVIEAINTEHEKSSLDNNDSKKPCDSKNCFVRIPKYNKTIENHDGNLNYHDPNYKLIKSNISVSKQKRKCKLFKIKDCIYDNDGEFLYKLPS